MARGSRNQPKQNYVPTKGSQGKANSNPQNRLPHFRQSKSVPSNAPPIQIPLNMQNNQGAPVQWPGMNPSGRPYPEMPEVPTDQTGHADYPLLESIGAPGTAIFAGIISSEEYNPDFFWRDGTKIFETMLRGDSQVNAIRNMVELPIRRASVTIEPASKSAKDGEIASFVETCLFHDLKYETDEGGWCTQKWDDVLRQILLYVWHGFMTFEKVWRIEDGWVKLARLMPLLPRTLWRWWIGEDNELVGIQQWTFKQYTYQFSNVPAHKLLRFTHRQEGQNYEGQSELRPIYKNWWMKTNLEKIAAVAAERNALTIPVVTLPPGHTQADVDFAQRLGQNLRANELASATIPYNWKAEYLDTHQRTAFNIDTLIEYHDIQMARSLLVQFLNLGSKEVGSYALADAQVQTFLSAIQTIAEYIEDVLNDDLIPELVDYNYDGVENYPKFRFTRMQADIHQLSELLKSLSGNKPLIPPYPELINWVIDQLGVPKPPDGTNLTELLNPTSPFNSMQPDTGVGGPNTTMQSQNVPGQNESTASNQPQSKEKNVPSETQNMAEDIAYLKMCFEAIDVVERGLTHASKCETACQV